MSDTEQGQGLFGWVDTYEKFIQLITGIMFVALISALLLSIYVGGSTVSTTWFELPIPDSPPVWHIIGYVTLIILLPFGSLLLRYVLDSFDRVCDDRFSSDK